MIEVARPDTEFLGDAHACRRRGRVLVTGATGLVGQGVVAALGENYGVVRLGRRPQCECRVDLDDSEAVAALRPGSFDAVIHCANLTDEDVADDPGAAQVCATRRTQNVVDLARKAEAKRFVIVSTAHVYGPLAGVVDESRPPDPRSNYAAAHLAAEQVVEGAAREGHFVAAALRPCAVFGIPLPLFDFRRWSLIPFDFPLQAVQNGRIVLKSSGEQRRNFISATDVGRVAMAWLAEETPPAWQVINPVGPDSLSVLAFAQLCAEAATAATGRQCTVTRAEPAATVPGADFEYRSLYPRGAGQDTLRPTIEALIARLCANLENSTPCQLRSHSTGISR